MVKSLEDAIQRIRQLPESEQVLLARFMLHQLDEDDAWRQTSEDHGPRLEGLVADIIAGQDTKRDRHHRDGQRDPGPAWGAA